MKKKGNMETVKKPKLKVNVLVLILALIIVISLTCLFAWAKYKSSINGNGIANIAQWTFKLTNGISQTEDVTNFAITRNEGDTDSVVEGMLAPGTNGKFAIGIDAMRNRNLTRI